MTQHDLIEALVRIWEPGLADAGERIVGTGILVSPRHVLTCAHVVTAALGGEAGKGAEPPARDVLLDFPASAPGRLVKGRVVVWHPREPRPGGVYDIAGLELDLAGEALPAGAAPASLALLEGTWNRPCRAFGFPAGRPDGNYAEGVLKDVLANGWVLIRGGADAREFTRPGYSGGPVYTPEGVVGVLTEGDRDGRVKEAVMIPTAVLLEAWPELYKLNSTCPYLGLSSFGEAHARFLRGREGVIQKLAERVGAPPFLTVLAGASGSGKSSVIFAGLVPHLKSRAKHRWQVVSFSPGIHPFEALAWALLPLWLPDLQGAARLGEIKGLSARLNEGSLELADILGELIGRHKEARLLVVLDQCEELFTQSPARPPEDDHPARRQRLLEHLLGALSRPGLQGRVSLLLAIRTDFLDGLLHYPPLAKLQRGSSVTEYLGPVEDLREVIDGPLKEVGIGRLEEGLAERILKDLSGEANPLPLLEFTLTELWRRQQAGRLTHAAYSVLGGVAQALATYAQAVFDDLSPEAWAQTREVFLQLAQPGEGSAVTRRVASLAELGESRRALVKTLADKHLVVTGRHQDNPDTVEVVHEALFEHWPLLREWVREGWVFRKWQEGLRAALRDWLEHAEHPDYLLQGARLAAAEAYLGNHEAQLTRQEQEFIGQSVRLREARARAETERLRREVRLQGQISRALAAFLVALVILSGAALWQWYEARLAQAESGRQAQATAALNARLEAANADLRDALVRSEDNAERALANKLSAQGLLATQNPGPTNGDPRLGALLAAQAVYIEDNVQSRGNLLRVLQSEPVLPSYREPTVAISPDGDTLVAVDADSLSVWEVATRQRLGDIHFEKNLSVASLAFSPDTRVLAVGGNDTSVQLWDLEASRPLGEPLHGHDYQVVGLTFSPDGAKLLSSAMNGTRVLWDLATGQAVARLERSALEPAEPPSPASGVLAFRRQTGVPPALEHLAWLRSPAFSPDGKMVALAGQKGTVELFDSLTLEPLGALLGAEAARSLAFSPDGRRLAAGSWDGAVQLWDVAAREPLGEPLLGLGSMVRALAFGANGDVLFTADARGTVILWDLSSRETLHGILALGAETVHSLSSSRFQTPIGGAVAWIADTTP